MQNLKSVSIGAFCVVFLVQLLYHNIEVMQ